jgi:hypothetical protein
VDISARRVGSYVDAVGSDTLKARMLVAAMAGLGRLTPEDAVSLGGDMGLDLTPRSRWEQALLAAAARGEPGTVAVIAAAGLQVPDWSLVPASHLFHIVAALHRVGLDPEARMIAAEAISRT